MDRINDFVSSNLCLILDFERIGYCDSTQQKSHYVQLPTYNNHKVYYCYTFLHGFEIMVVILTNQERDRLLKESKLPVQKISIIKLKNKNHLRYKEFALFRTNESGFEAIDNDIFEQTRLHADGSLAFSCGVNQIFLRMSSLPPQIIPDPHFSLDKRN